MWPFKKKYSDKQKEMARDVLDSIRNYRLYGGALTIEDRLTWSRHFSKLCDMFMSEIGETDRICNKKNIIGVDGWARYVLDEPSDVVYGIKVYGQA